MDAVQPVNLFEAIKEARRQLRSVPIPWHEFEQAAVDISRLYPSATGPELVRLIAITAMDQWCIGTGGS